jgi:hypothetical protein
MNPEPVIRVSEPEIDMNRTVPHARLNRARLKVSQLATAALRWLYLSSSAPGSMDPPRRSVDREFSA